MAKFYKDPAHPEKGDIDEVDFCQLMDTVARMSSEIDRLRRNEVNILHGWQGLMKLKANTVKIAQTYRRFIPLTREEYEVMQGQTIEVFWREQHGD